MSPNAGSSQQGRSTAIREFKKNPKCTVCLQALGVPVKGKLSLISPNFTFQSSCIVRIDLIAGHNVHLMEPHWNPMVEAQAVNRVHRIGQTRDVIVERYIADDLIEQVIYVALAQCRLGQGYISNIDTSICNGYNKTRPDLFINLLTHSVYCCLI